MGNRITRRRLLRTGGGVAVAAACASAIGVAASCGGRSTRGTSGPRDLRMTWWGGQARTAAYQQALALFQQRHKDVVVTTEYSGYDGYFDRFDEEVAGGNPPDLLQMDTALVNEYSRRGLLRPLDEYTSKGLDLSGFPDALLATGRVGSRLYGVPSGTGVALVTYDVSVLRSVRVDPPRSDWTWPDLQAQARRLTRALGGGVYGCSDGGGDDEGALQIFLRQRRKDLFDPGGGLGYGPADLTEWLAFWEEMRRTKAAAPGEVTAAAHNDSAKNPLITGRTAMTFGTGLEISLPPLTRHDLDFVPLPLAPPGGAEGEYLSGGVLLCSFARSALGQDAADIMNFFANDDDAIRIMGITRGIPPTEKARQVASAHLNPAQQRALAATNLVARRVAAAGAAAPPAPPRGAGQVKELLFNSNLAVAFGRKTVAAAVQSFFAGAASALS